jgi:hypothetical protein
MEVAQVVGVGQLDQLDWVVNVALGEGLYTKKQCKKERRRRMYFFDAFVFHQPATSSRLVLSDIATLLLFPLADQLPILVVADTASP